MTADDRRIAWLLNADVAAGSMAATKACLSMAAEAGFRAVAIDPSGAVSVGDLGIEAEAMRLGMHCIVVNEAAHYRLAERLSDAACWSEARALSRDGFDGLILCESSDSPDQASSLLAVARALLRRLDQLDWESYQ